MARFHFRAAVLFLALSLALPLAANAEALVGPLAARPTAIALPSRALPGAIVDGSAFDALLVSELEQQGVLVADRRKRMAEKCEAGRAELELAEQRYVSMDLVGALAAARQAALASNEAFGDLLHCIALRRALLLETQLLLDLGRRVEALQRATEVAAEDPGLTLDPMIYPPAMLALWTEVGRARKEAAVAVAMPDLERAAALGRHLEVDWVVGARATSLKGGLERWLFFAVPSREPGAAVQQELELQPPTRLATAMRAALKRPFPAPEQAKAPVKSTANNPIARPAGEKVMVDARDKKKPWYKTWWFWTAAGVVVAGAGVAVGVVVYRANQPDQDTPVRPQ